MATIDQFNDPTLALLVNLVADRPRVVELVKEAEVLPEEAESLPDTAFAWPEKRAFPIFSREHAVMSRVYAENTLRVPPRVTASIKEACDMYGVDESVFERAKVAAAPDDPEDYLLPAMKRLPVRNAEQVKTAEATLMAGYQKLAFENRALACSRLIEKAAAFGVTLDPLMHKLAGFTVSSTAVVRDWLGAREDAAPAAYKEAFHKLGAALKKMPAEMRNRDELVKLAEVIGDLDRKAGLEKHYDRKLPDPLMTVFNTTKVAGHGVDLNGRFVSTAKLAQYPASFYSDVLGDDIMSEASDGRGGFDAQKLAMILETLPRDMKVLLSSHLRP